MAAAAWPRSAAPPACISPVTAATAVAVGAVVGRASGSAARGINVGFAVYPVLQLAVDGPRRTAATGALMALIGFRFWQASAPRRS